MLAFKVRIDDGAHVPSQFGTKSDKRVSSSISAQRVDGDVKAKAESSNKRLLPDVLERVVVPLLLPSISELWNPASVTQSEALTLCLKELAGKGINTTAQGMLKNCLATSIRDFLHHFRLPYISLPPPTDNQEPHPCINAATRTHATNFLSHSFGVSIAVLVNLTKVSSVLHSPSIVAAILQLLVSKQITFICAAVSNTYSLAMAATCRNGASALDIENETDLKGQLDFVVQRSRSVFRAIPAMWLQDRNTLSNVCV